MKKIRFRYGAILFFIILISLLWEFYLQDILNQHWMSRSVPGSFSERLEYVATIFVFCLVALLCPYLHDIKEIRKQTRRKLAVGCLTPHFHEASTEIKKSPGMVTICSWCKKIHEDRDVWIQLEAYLDEHSDAIFSHGLCPDCLEIQLSQIEKFE
jgi:hypothetical protein